MANKKNPEGYTDMTAYTALEAVNRSEREVKSKCDNLIGCLKLFADLAGFEFIGRIQLRHKDSGREFR